MAKVIKTEGDFSYMDDMPRPRLKKLIVKNFR